MFTTTGLKRIFYGQTGNFQFGCDFTVDNYTGTMNFGLSGSGVNNINFLFSGGKIIDNSSRFIQNYPINSIFSLSGNLNSGSYDIFYNGNPISYNNNKSTGIYNYFYIKPNNVNTTYNFYLNGDTPNLTISNINCSTGDIVATGTIINNKLPIRIYGGRFSNFNSGNSIFSLSGVSTGDLSSPSIGKFYILPSGSSSIGSYIGNLQLTTNAGNLTYPITINITGSPNVVENSIILNGQENIFANTVQLYTANINSNISSGLPILVSLSHISGSGDYYKYIDIFSGWSGNISGFIQNQGIISQLAIGIGSGTGGQLNNLATGFASGIITGTTQFATGIFVWDYSLLVSGYGTGTNYSGIGTGLLYDYILGPISNGSGTYFYNSYITGTTGNLRSLNATGFIHGTGAIYYNTPSNFDKLYINDNNTAIINNFSYFGMTGLTTYINNNTGTHLVTAINDGINTITLSGIRGAATNVSLLVDDTNLGNMSLSDSSLIGGRDLGIGNILNSNLFTGFLNQTFTGSGYYTQFASGTINGSGRVLDHIKTFTGSWNLLTGASPFNQVDYLLNNFINNTFSTYQNNNPINYVNSTSYININYINTKDQNNDVAMLTITGLGFDTGISIQITGVF